MTIRKNGFTYLTWFLYLIVTFFTLLVTSEGITSKYGKTNDIPFMCIVFFAIIIVSCLVLLANHLLTKFLANNNPFSKEATPYVTGVILFFIVVLGFMARFIFLVSSDETFIGSTTVYYYALNNDFKSAIEISPIISLYSKLLSFVLYTFGSLITTAVYLNIVFDVLTVIFSFLLVKRLSNSTFAAIAALFISFLPYNLVNILLVAPGKFYVFLLSIALWAMTEGVYLLIHKTDKQKSGVVCLIISGIFTGVLCVCDVTSLILIISFIILNAGIIKNELIKPVSRFVRYISYFVPSFIAFAVCSFVIIGGTGYSQADLINNFYFFSFDKAEFNMFITSPAYGTYGSILIVGLSILWIIRCLMVKYDLGSYIIIIGTIFGILTLFGIEKISYSMVITYLWCIYAVFGIDSFSQKAIKSPNDKNNKTNIIGREDDVFKKKDSNKIVSGNTIMLSTKAEDSASRAKELEASLDFLKKAHEPESDEDNSGDVLENVSREVDITPEEADKLAQDSAELTAKINQANKPINRSYRAMNYKTAVVTKNTDSEEIGKEENNDNTEVVNNPSTSKPSYVNDKLDEVVTVAGHTVTKSELYSTMFGNEDTVVEERTKQDIEKPVEVIRHISSKSAEQMIRNIEEKKANETNGDSPINKYGRRMDYKTAVVNKTSEDTTDVTSQDADVLEKTADESDATVKALEDTSEKIEVLDAKEIEESSDNTGKDNSAVSEDESEEKKITYIHNPLPTPKKTIQKELDFDIDPPVSDMHFDIVNLAGQDFFDIN